MQYYKCAVVGDGSIGKTCMIISYSTDTFPDEYIPTVVDNHTVNVVADDFAAQLIVWDTAGQEDYDRLRPLSYPQTDVFLLCFSTVDRQSLDNVKERWYPELVHNCPTAPIVLVGTKKDLRDDPGSGHIPNYGISYEQGLVIMREIGAVEYLECSAKTRQGLNEVFVAALKAIITPKKTSKRRRCNLL